jgi:hypothetical protein
VPEIQVKLPGGTVRQAPAGTTPAELLDTTDAAAALVDGEPWDLNRPWTATPPWPPCRPPAAAAAAVV